jgi:hypothetical protein
MYIVQRHKRATLPFITKTLYNNKPFKEPDNVGDSQSISTCSPLYGEARRFRLDLF